MRIGTIKRCVNCGQESYVRTGVETCPECNENFSVKKNPNKSPEVITFLGTNELNRRSVVELRKQNLIDDF